LHFRAASGNNGYMDAQFTKRLVIDSHHHLGRKMRQGQPFRVSGDDVIRSMDATGVDLTIVMHFVAALRTSEDFVAANDLAVAECAAHPDRLVPIAVVHPFLPRAGSAELSRCAELGIRGVKLHPIAHGYYELDRAVDPLVRAAGEAGLPVVIHSDFAHHVCSPYAIAALARRCPETTIVLLHLGLQPAMCHLVPEVVESEPNVIVDTSQTCDKPDEVYGRPVALLGAERVMFGSDGPECDVSVNLLKLAAALERGVLTERDADLVLAGTARLVFGVGATLEMSRIR
jgi:predicted TIM-barrel fold metal-dependent hydrolase